MDNRIFSWSEEKNKILKTNRGISFEEIIAAIYNDGLIEIIPNPSKNHEDQECFIIEINGYIYIVPYVEDKNGIFLKTIYRSKKYKKLLLNK